MLCAFYIKHNSRPKQCVRGRAGWVNIACQTVIWQSLNEHERRLSHKEALILEVTQVLANKDGRIPAFDKAISEKVWYSGFSITQTAVCQYILNTARTNELVRISKQPIKSYCYIHVPADMTDKRALLWASGWSTSLAFSCDYLVERRLWASRANRDPCLYS